MSSRTKAALSGASLLILLTLAWFMPMAADRSGSSGPERAEEKSSERNRVGVPSTSESATEERTTAQEPPATSPTTPTAGERGATTPSGAVPPPSPPDGRNPSSPETPDLSEEGVAEEQVSLSPPAIRSTASFRGPKAKEGKIRLQVAVATIPEPEIRGLISISLADGTPIGEEKIRRSTRSTVAEVADADRDGPWVWRVFDLVLDERRIEKQIGRFPELPWAVTVDLEHPVVRYRAGLGSGPESRLPRTGVGMLTTRVPRPGRDVPLATVITVPVSGDRAIEIRTGESTNVQLLRRSLRGTTSVRSLGREWRGQSVGSWQVPALAFPSTQVVRLTEAGKVSRDFAFDDLIPGESLELEAGAIVVADIGVEAWHYQDLSLEVAPPAPAAPTGRTLSVFGAGSPLRLSPVPPGVATLRLRLRRDMIWERSIDLPIGVTDVTDLLPSLDSIVRSIHLEVRWPEGELGVGVNAHLTLPEERNFLLPFMDSHGVRQSESPNEHNWLLVRREDARIGTIEFIRPQEPFEPVEVDLSRSEWFIEAIPESP